MKDYDLNKFLITLLAAFAIYLPISSTPSASERPQSPALVQMGTLAPPTPTPTPTPGPGQVPGEAARLLCDYFGFKPDVDRDARGQNNGLKQDQSAELRDFDPKNLKGDYCRILNRVKSLPAIEYLIATVPDPIDSRLDHQFDRYLDAIQRAIADAGYAFDRYSLPWDKSKTAAPVVLPAEPKAPQTPPRHLYEPGVILFRGNKKLLLLFLVGETPTGGIHRVAFKNALWQIGKLDDWKRSGAVDETAKTAKKTLQIVGPSFSGSADSLEILLRSWMGEYKAPPQVKVVSGSANSIEKDDFFARKIDFHATTIWLEQASDRFYEYLQTLDRSVKPGGDDRPARAQIAWLSEAVTGSGQNVRKVAGNAKSREDQSSSSRPSTLSFIFPLHISQLRVEAARQSRSRVEAPYALAPKNQNLALPMGEAGGPGSKDIVPLFSPLETVTMELSLDEELEAIHREQIRYVGVSATDPQDRIFLVREIRKHCPNATVFFILGNDLLYMHSERNPDFQGALVISPYPLFGLNQLWTYPFAGIQSRERFSTNSSQGIYNATLALLGETGKMLEYGYPFQTYQEGDPRYPALWLGIVGRNGIWPVKAFKFDNARDEKKYTLPAEVPSSDAVASTTGEKARPRLGLSGNYWSSTGLVVLLLIGAICLLLPMVFLAQSMPIWPRAERVLPRLMAWIRRRWITRVFGDEECYHYRQGRRINLMFCCASLLTGAVFISSVTLLPALITRELTEGGVIKARWNQHLVFGLVAGGMLFFALVTLCLLVAHVIDRVIGEWRYFCIHIELWLVLVVGGAMIAFVFLSLIKVLHADWCDQVFYFLRASDLTNGVSLLLPGLLILLAAFLSFFTSVRRLNLAERMPCMPEPRQRPGEAPQFPRFDREGARSFRWLKPLEDHVKEMIVSPIYKTPGAWLIAIVSFCVYWLLFAKRFIPSVEGFEFDCFFKLGFYIVPLLLFLALLRFFRLWTALERLLHWLSWHPLISSFTARQSEKERFASLPPVDMMTSRPAFVAALSVSALQARTFSDSLKQPPPKQAETVERIKFLVKEAEDKLFHADATGDWKEALIGRRASQAALTELSELSAGLLEDSWWKDGGEKAKDGGEKAKDGGEKADADWPCEGQFFLITHVVAFLHYVFAQLQNLVALVTIGLLLMLITTTSYPFQPREPLLWFSWVGILTSVAVTIYVFVKISRDKTLSLLAGTMPGRLNFTRDFVARVMFHGVIPLIAMLGVQFPDTVRRIFSWLSGVAEGKGT